MLICFNLWPQVFSYAQTTLHIFKNTTYITEVTLWFTNKYCVITQIQTVCVCVCVCVCVRACVHACVCVCAELITQAWLRYKYPSTRKGKKIMDIHIKV